MTEKKAPYRKGNVQMEVGEPWQEDGYDRYKKITVGEAIQRKPNAPVTVELYVTIDAGTKLKIWLETEEEKKARKESNKKEELPF